MTGGSPGGVRYVAPVEDGHPAKHIVPALAPGDAPRFTFFGRLEIGRDDDGRRDPGLLLLADPTVSRHHCVVTQHASGRCFVRDVSRNGTRLEGRRLVPNVETEWHPEQTLSIGAGHAFLLLGAPGPGCSSGELFLTVPRPEQRVATVLVGDIRDYTVLVRTAPTEELQRSVKAVFEALSDAVAAHGGTVKEYQGDAILAYWEGDVSGRQVPRACRAAAALDALAQRLAADRAVWRLPFPLVLEWALCTGIVLIDSIGRKETAGLSMMGEPVVRAFRLEKFAGPDTGRVVVCEETRRAAGDALAFRDLGERTAKGFDRPDRIFALDP